MENLKIASVQFENRSGDKTYNLGVIRELAAPSSGAGSRCSCLSRMFNHRLYLCSELVPGGDAGFGGTDP